MIVLFELKNVDFDCIYGYVEIFCDFLIWVVCFFIFNV